MATGLSENSFRPVVFSTLGVNGVGAANSQIVIPSNSYIDMILFKETAGNAVTGGIKIGTTVGGTDIVSSQAVPASTAGHINDSTMQTRVFTAPQTLYIGAVSSWNGAKVNFTIIIGAIQ